MAKLNKANKIIPILKWVGGKRQLLDRIIPLVPEKFNNYIEPFFGGGALFFSLEPSSAIINDFNAELINTYQVIKNKPQELIFELEEHQKLHSKAHFYQVRNLDRSKNFGQISDVKRAARIIYLNRTCYNGLYRVNQAGQFNSPFGYYKNPSILNKTLIWTISKFLNKNKIEIFSCDYRQILDSLEKDDFVYLDPPYLPISASSSFTSYTEKGFNIQEQIQLKRECDKLNAKGIKFLLSNSDHPFFYKLYKDYEIITVRAKRLVNSQAENRQNVNEILIRNYS